MGTRSIVTFKSEWDGEEICAIYRQFDGYPEGRGKELANFLDGYRIGNGIAIKIKNNIRTASCLMFDGINFEDIINLFPFGTALIEIMTHPDGVIYQIHVEGADYSVLTNGTYVFRDEKDFSIYWLGSLDVHLQNGWEIVA